MWERDISFPKGFRWKQGTYWSKMAIKETHTDKSDRAERCQPGFQRKVTPHRSAGAIWNSQGAFPSFFMKDFVPANRRKTRKNFQHGGWLSALPYQIDVEILVVQNWNKEWAKTKKGKSFRRYKTIYKEPKSELKPGSRTFLWIQVGKKMAK